MTATQQPEALSLEEFRAKVTHAAREPLLARIAELEDDLQFVERWAVHHGSKPSISAEEALSCIQHYPAIHEITKSYKDGKRPDTFNPYARIADLEAQLSAIGAGGVEPLRKKAVEEGGEDTLTMAAAIIMQREADARDAARYRWLRNQMLGVDFDWCGNGITALVFEVPDGCAYSRNCDQNIDAAVAVQAKQGEKK